MHFHDETPRTGDIVQQLIRLRPKPRLFAGITCMVVSSLVAIGLWDYGVIWGATLFFFFIGFLLVVSGALGIRRDRKRETDAGEIEAHRDEIVRAMVEAKRVGKNPIRLLNEKGIHEAAIRTALIEEMNQRLKS